MSGIDRMARAGRARGGSDSLVESLESRRMLSVVLPAKGITLVETNGDTYTMRLKGPGAVNYDLDPVANTPTGISIEGTTEKSVLVITVKKSRATDGVIEIGEIVSTSPLKALTAKNCDLNGVDFAGNHVGSIIARDVQGVGIAVGGEPTQYVSLAVRDVTGDMMFDAAVKKMSVRDMRFSSLTAPAIGNLTAAGDILVYSIRLTGPANTTVLGGFNAKGTIDSSEIIAELGNIGSVVIGRVVDSNIFAGTDFLPFDVTDFNAPTSIKSVVIKGLKGEPFGVVNSTLAAARMGSATVANPDFDNGSSVIVADSLKKISWRGYDLDGFYRRGSISNLDDPADSIDYGSCEVRLV